MQRHMPVNACPDMKDDMNEFYFNLEKVFEKQSNQLIIKQCKHFLFIHHTYIIDCIDHNEMELRKQEEKEAQLRELIKKTKFEV